MRRTRNNVRKFGSDITNFEPIHPRPLEDENLENLNNFSQIPKERLSKPKQECQTLKETKKKEKGLLHSSCFVQERLEEIMNFTYNYQGRILDSSLLPAMSKQVILDEEKYVFQPCPELSISMRNILIQWLIEVHYKMCLRHETLYLTIYLVDKYCCSRQVTKTNYQLLAIACLFIAGKYQQIATPKMKKFVSLCDKLYGIEDILQMESQVLLLLNFKISQPSINWFLGTQLFAISRQSSKSRTKAYWQKFERFCYYLLELVLFQIKLLLKYPPEVISSSILFYICMQQEYLQVDSKKSTNYLTAFQMKQVRECSLEIRKINRSKNEAKYQSVNNKYPDLATPDSSI